MVVFVAACSPGGAPSPSTDDGRTTTPTSEVATTVPPAGEGCADVIGVEIAPAGDGFTVSATVRSADTGWDKYADRWEVRTLDGDVIGVRELAHPHETEQPFTRSLSGVEIPPEVTEVQVWARDSVAGFCGRPFTATVPGRS